MPIFLARIQGRAECLCRDQTLLIITSTLLPTLIILLFFFYLCYLTNVMKGEVVTSIMISMCVEMLIVHSQKTSVVSG